MVSQPPSALCKNFRSCEVTPWHTSAISQPRTSISQLPKWLRNLHALKSSISQPRRHFKGCFVAVEPPFGTRVPLCSAVTPFHSWEMGCEKRPPAVPIGAKPEHPPICLLRLSKSRTPPTVFADTPPQPRVVPPPVEDAPISPPPRRYNIRRSLTIVGVSSSRGHKSGTNPPKKKAKVSEPIDLTESSLEPESEPTPSPQPAKKSSPPAKKPQPSQTPAKESQIPLGMTPDVVIRRPMVTQPPIEGNLDYKARPFHSELCFDIATFRIQPKLRESFRLLQRGASSRHYILRKELPPSMFFIDALLRHNIFPLQHWVQRRGVLLEALFRISKGYFFGPHHLIMAALLYFEEKPEEPVDILVDTHPPAPTVAPTEPIPEVAPSAPQATPQTPPVIPPTLEPSPSAEPRIDIPIIEYRGLCHTF
ncbi:hypothetical protein CK203_113666 [Vitis vinifera]|uniref:Uncharacterized protein n=1 Tax=Vitis vinifera TaxID=29760 RepID=A0A438CZ61_VITVI|nr:hypothetical protein CK203_113666 [Vitis vinifera]